MVIDLKQNNKEENKTFKFFWISLIPGGRSIVQRFQLRGVTTAVTPGAVRVGPPSGSSTSPK